VELTQRTTHIAEALRDVVLAAAHVLNGRLGASNQRGIEAHLTSNDFDPGMRKSDPHEWQRQEDRLVFSCDLNAPANWDWAPQARLLGHQITSCLTRFRACRGKAREVCALIVTKALFVGQDVEENNA
jgi:hypothetical protein